MTDKPPNNLFSQRKLKDFRKAHQEAKQPTEPTPEQMQEITTDPRISNVGVEQPQPDPAVSSVGYDQHFKSVLATCGHTTLMPYRTTDDPDHTEKRLLREQGRACKECRLKAEQDKQAAAKAAKEQRKSAAERRRKQLKATLFRLPHGTVFTGRYDHTKGRWTVTMTITDSEGNTTSTTFVDPGIHFALKKLGWDWREAFKAECKKLGIEVPREYSCNDKKEQ